MTRPQVRLQFGPILKEYGAFRLRKASLLQADGHLLHTLTGYQITLPRPPREDGLVTSVLVDELPAVIAALRHWLELHGHMLNVWSETLESFGQPEGRARLQATMDKDDARTGFISHLHLSVDEVIANQGMTYEEETRRHRRVEEALAELEASSSTAK